jgi:hypothetical protein
MASHAHAQHSRPLHLRRKSRASRRRPVPRPAPPRWPGRRLQGTSLGARGARRRKGGSASASSKGCSCSSRAARWRSPRPTTSCRCCGGAAGRPGRRRRSAAASARRPRRGCGGRGSSGQRWPPGGRRCSAGAAAARVQLAKAPQCTDRWGKHGSSAVGHMSSPVALGCTPLHSRARPSRLVAGAGARWAERCRRLRSCGALGGARSLGAASEACGLGRQLGCTGGARRRLVPCAPSVSQPRAPRPGGFRPLPCSVRACAGARWWPGGATPRSRCEASSHVHNRGHAPSQAFACRTLAPHTLASSRAIRHRLLRPPCRRRPASSCSWSSRRAARPTRGCGPPSARKLSPRGATRRGGRRPSAARRSGTTRRGARPGCCSRRSGGRGRRRGGSPRKRGDRLELRARRMRAWWWGRRCTCWPPKPAGPPPDARLIALRARGAQVLPSMSRFGSGRRGRAHRRCKGQRARSSAGRVPGCLGQKQKKGGRQLRKPSEER